MDFKAFVTKTGSFVGGWTRKNCKCSCFTFSISVPYTVHTQDKWAIQTV